MRTQLFKPSLYGHAACSISNAVVCCVQMVECRTDRDEEAAIVQCIREQQSAGVPFADMAVLFRTVSQGKAVERALVSILSTSACSMTLSRRYAFSPRLFISGHNLYSQDQRM